MMTHTIDPDLPAPVKELAHAITTQPHIEEQLPLF
jgi:hypothetical protein